MSSILISGGTVIDGTGADPRQADVRIRDGVFAEVGPSLAAREDDRIVDARGREILPGFIDAHSHDDAALLRPGAMAPKLSQGVTTTVIGNCGHGCAPSGAGAALRDYSTPILGPFPDEHYGTFGDYLDALDRAELALDVVALVPHAPLRSAVLGMERRPATAAETARVVGLLDEALSAGATGLSYGLMYSPGNAAARDELEAIAGAVARAGKVLVAHVRNEADLLQTSLDEFLVLGRSTGCAVHVSHLKVTGPRNFGTMPAIIDKLEAARADGLDVTADIYPYEAGSTTAATLFPSWSTDRGVDSLLEVLADPAARRRALDDMRRPWTGALENYFHTLGPAAILLAGFGTEANVGLEGMRLSDIAAFRGQDAAECFADLMREEGGAITVVLFQTDIEGMKAALSWPHTIVGSDGLPREHGYVHPRLFGTFPRVLARYAGQGGVLSRHEAVHRMTGATARRFRLHSGVIAPGSPAALQIIDPRVYSDRADFNSPREETAGLDTVYVAGRVAWGAGPGAVGAGRLHRERVVAGAR
ncbi:N-acyl-D-amino-acid deacylase family protein [Microbacterium sp. RD1]|uniref:N-acyl-D-amino-acid deacylase family protein n=1 Tax=Microbacterium sp. RD1 TaxID=3457313 RepID=UPI003FA5A50D